MAVKFGELCINSFQCRGHKIAAAAAAEAATKYNSELAQKEKEDLFELSRFVSFPGIIPICKLQHNPICIPHSSASFPHFTITTHHRKTPQRLGQLYTHTTQAN